MPRYKLDKPHYLDNRYYAEGSVVDYDGPPSKSMSALDDDGKARVAERQAAGKARPAASEVPQPGGEPPDPTWAPQPKPAFSVKTTRKPSPDDPDDQSTVVRVPAAPPTGGTKGKPADVEPAPVETAKPERAFGDDKPSRK